MVKYGYGHGYGSRRGGGYASKGYHSRTGRSWGKKAVEKPSLAGVSVGAGDAAPEVRPVELPVEKAPEVTTGKVVVASGSSGLSDELRAAIMSVVTEAVKAEVATCVSHVVDASGKVAAIAGATEQRLLSAVSESRLEVLGAVGKGQKAVRAEVQDLAGRVGTLESCLKDVKESVGFASGSLKEAVTELQDQRVGAACVSATQELDSVFRDLKRLTFSLPPGGGVRVAAVGEAAKAGEADCEDPVGHEERENDARRRRREKERRLKEEDRLRRDIHAGEEEEKERRRR